MRKLKKKIYFCTFILYFFSDDVCPSSHCIGYLKLRHTANAKPLNPTRYPFDSTHCIGGLNISLNVTYGNIGIII